MSKYTYKLYAVDWVYSDRVFSCFSQYNDLSPDPNDPLEFFNDLISFKCAK